MKLSAAALPQEHGAWGFFLESALVGFLLAFNLQSCWIFFTSLFLFLSYQPFKRLLLRWVLTKTWDRDSWLEFKILLVYGFSSGLGAYQARLWIVTELWFWMMGGIFLAMIQIFYLLRQKQRALGGELSGALALSIVGPMMIQSKFPLSITALSYLLITLRLIPSILTVRTLILKSKGKSSNSSVPLMAWILAGVVFPIIIFYFPKLIYLGALFFSIAAYSIRLLLISSFLSPKELGWRQMMIGVIFSLGLVFSFRSL